MTNWNDDVPVDELAYWRNRGEYDCVRQRAPLFRNTRAYGIVPELDPPNDWTDADIQDRGEAYLVGFNAALAEY